MENDVPRKSLKEKRNEDDIDPESKYVGTSELFFVILPFIVLAMVLGHKGELYTIFYSPEWSIVSVVICGQTIVRFVGAVLGPSAYRERIMMALSGMIVFLFIPNVLILSIVLSVDKISTTLASFQLSIFCIDAILYFIATVLHSDAQKKSD